MASLFQSLRWVHIAAGSIALILFWIPAVAPKGGRTHIRAGWVYVVCMSVVVVTAFVMSGLAFTIPVAVRQIARPLSPAELSDFLRVQRIFATFLAYLAGVTLASGWHRAGRESGRSRQGAIRKRCARPSVWRSTWQYSSAV